MTENGASSYHRYLQGDPHALEELVKAYSDALVRYILLYVHDFSVAEDIMEESFATLIVKRKQLPDTPHFQAYLYRIARNKSVDFLRSKRRKELPLSDFEETLLSADAGESAEKRERDKTVLECLFKLPAPLRDALYFTYFEGMKPAELALSMNVGRKKVYNLLARGKRALKEILLKEGIGYDDL